MCLVDFIYWYLVFRSDVAPSFIFEVFSRLFDFPLVPVGAPAAIHKYEYF